MAGATKPNEKEEDVVQSILSKAKPILGNIGFGSIVGYCSGLAMRSIGRAAAVLIGGTFIGLQVAVGMGYIDVKWDKVGDQTKQAIDVNADGQLNVDDAKEYWKRLRKVLTHKIPSAGGFSLGFLYGVRHG